MAHSKKAKRKNKVILYLEFIPFFCLYKFARMMPLKLVHRIFTFLFVLLYYVDRRHRRRSIQHLLHAGVAKDLAEAKRIALASFKHGGRLLTELVKIDGNFFKENITFTGNEEAYTKLLFSGENNIPVILVTAHYGNWEIAGRAWTEFSGRKLITVIRALDNPLIGKYIYQGRSGGKHEIVPKNVSIKYMLKALRDGDCVAIVADQHASSREGVETIFFGQPARTHASIAALHLRTGAPIAPLVLRCRDELFHYDAVFSEIIRYEPTDDKAKDIAAITQMFTTALEKLIAGKPEQWLWSHRRWLNINRKQRAPKAQEASS